MGFVNNNALLPKVNNATLKDSIKDFGNLGGGNGYTFARYVVEDLSNSIKRAIYDYNNDKKGWDEKIKTCMTTDFSWNKSIRSYLEVYKSL